MEAPDRQFRRRALSDAQFAEAPLRRRLPFQVNAWSIFGATGGVGSGEIVVLSAARTTT
jgi:hypothetical protein